MKLRMLEPGERVFSREIPEEEFTDPRESVKRIGKELKKEREAMEVAMLPSVLLVRHEYLKDEEYYEFLKKFLMSMWEVSEVPEIRENYYNAFKETIEFYFSECGHDAEKWQATDKEGRLEKDYLLNLVKERCKNERCNID